MNTPPYNAEDLQNFQTAKSQMIANLMQITATPKPNYSIGGQSISWSEYQKMLLDGIQAANETEQQLSGPFVIVTGQRG